jgi:hypothetical protein
MSETAAKKDKPTRAFVDLDECLPGDDKYDVIDLYTSQRKGDIQP